MDKTFQPERIERRWYEAWERNGYFSPKGHGDPYCIMIPPPNVTGSLHMGHGFQEAIMDALIRYHRMCGRRTLWQVGTDHAGIATQMIVERQLEAEGSSRHEIGRDAFVDRVWAWKRQSGGHITRQLRRLGASPDWSRERFTMDEGLSHAVREVFVRLHEEGLIYRRRRLVNWDPVLRTAISDLEVVSEEEQGQLWHFRYPLADGSGSLVVATTRPETMLGDTAVAVHPDDERYRHLVGAEVRLPLVDRLIPVIADDYVEREFGTGCVKITPAHDFNDHAMGERHDLEVINILREDATLNDAVPEAYRGLDRFEARDRVVHDFRELGFLEKVEAHTLKVPRGDRTGVVIEPFLTLQWYVDARRLAGPAIAAVERGDIEFVPRQWQNTYFAWMRGIEDWCISRQLWWGHRIPAWYGPDGEVYVGRSESEVRARHGLDDATPLRQDDDVLDTWFSSALWTFSTLGWPEETPELKTFHPTSVLVTGFDIIFFWVARMIMMTLHLRSEVPFRQVYVHGLVRDNDGQKMSKSKGNVLDPIDLIDGIGLEDLVQKRTAGLMQPRLAARIEKATRKQFPTGISAYGTDALRFTYYSLAATGRDIRFDVGRIEGFRNFGNKIWNAARFVLMTCEGQDCGETRQELPLALADRWILSALQDSVARLRGELEQYRFDLASQLIYDFIWSQYCDWYLELSKATLRSEGSTPEQCAATRQTLLRVLETTLRLLHPLMPFLTEEIWQAVAPLAGVRGESIMLQSYPEADRSLVDSDAEEELAWLRAVVTAVRTVRSEANVPPGQAVGLLLRNGDETDRQRAQRHGHLIRELARVAQIDWAGEAPPPAAAALVGGLEVLLPLEGLIDRDAELARLDRELKRLEAEALRTRGKLSRPEFVERAPADVVEREREKSAAQDRDLHRLRIQRQKIASLAR